MPRKAINKFLPDPDKIKNNKTLNMFGSRLHDPSLWHLNRRSARLAFAIGLFFAFIPTPFQMVFAAGFAIFFRANLPIAVALVWLTNPITMPPIFFMAYAIGETVLGNPLQSFVFEASWEWLVNSLETIGPAFLLGSLICACTSAIIGFFAIDWIWRCSVNNQRKKRKLAQKT